MNHLPNDTESLIFSEDIQKWQKRMEKFAPIVLQAKKRVLDVLKLSANTIVEEIGNKSVANTAPPMLMEYANQVLSMNVNNMNVYKNNEMGTEDFRFKQLPDDKNLTYQQNLVLTALSLLESLKSWPYQTPEELFDEVRPSLKESFHKQDREELARWQGDWIEKKEKFEQILHELEDMNISKNGTVTPGYLREVK